MPASEPLATPASSSSPLLCSPQCPSTTAVLRLTTMGTRRGWVTISWPSSATSPLTWVEPTTVSFLVQQ